jgi:Tol biopolymer transport system component
MKQFTVFLMLIGFFACQNKEVIENGYLSYTSNADSTFSIHGIMEDGTEQHQITHAKELDAHSSWIPDGSHLVFSRSVNGNYDIYMAKADGSNIKRLTTDTAYDLVPSFSPDGKKIVFESNRTGIYQIFSMDTNGEQQTQLTFSGAGTTNYGGKYSPDGKSIAFASSRDNDTSVHIKYNDIYLMNTDGSNVKRLTTNMNNEAGRAWSPDGKRMVFSAVIDSVAQLFVMNADGTNQTQITHSKGNPHPFSPGALFPVFRGEVTPSWSPDGKRIAFASDRDLDYQIYTINPDGTNPKQITKTKGYQLSTGWQPQVKK